MNRTTNFDPVILARLGVLSVLVTMVSNFILLFTTLGTLHNVLSDEAQAESDKEDIKQKIKQYQDQLLLLERK